MQHPVRRLPALSRVNLPNVYAILDFQTCLERNLDPRTIVKSWCDAGIELIQIRAKNLSDLNFWVFAETIKECSLPYNLTTIINRRIDIAHGLEFDGVHLPSSGLPVEAIRKTFPEMLVFASCHNKKEIEVRKDADAITISPIYSTLSKQDDNRPTVGLTEFRELSLLFPGKTYALGGIDEKKIVGMKGVSIASLGFLTKSNAFENAKILVSRGNL